MAKDVGVDAVEIRNDLKDQALGNGYSVAKARADADEAGVKVLTINALMDFNAWNDERATRAAEVIGAAAELGAMGVILVPYFTDRKPPEETVRAELDAAFKGLQPILSRHAMIGLVEPLGFERCSLSSKRIAADAIKALGGSEFRLVQDTFHHYVAGEPESYPEITGLIHISGVERTIPPAEMSDDDRIFVGEGDVLGTIEQTRHFIDRGYDGYISFEPFSPALRNDPDPRATIARSIDYVRQALVQ
ncbi:MULTISPECIES: TIM barrel protein [unclassified Shinella]|uniref:TIM barrel protein n=1 Tax=unclassified Shinella TaxID=2643062 RepID=UPI00225D94A8|nr:TIM barrel protein [Shinella sp. YE25]MDC7260126.1 TIM barrel protein [Shinella sp. YE25]CAI0341133.1 Inosose isomerase [Rhizobiaceae bacterium]CAK7262168.1 2-keto-myo-inositol isomerase [Shinella sp. WSC3-e]